MPFCVMLWVNPIDLNAKIVNISLGTLENITHLFSITRRGWEKSPSSCSWADEHDLSMGIGCYFSQAKKKLLLASALIIFFSNPIVYITLFWEEIKQGIGKYGVTTIFAHMQSQNHPISGPLTYQSLYYLFTHLVLHGFKLCGPMFFFFF